MNLIAATSSCTTCTPSIQTLTCSWVSIRTAFDGRRYFDAHASLTGYHTSAIQSFVLGDGYSLKIPYWKPSFPHPTEISHYVTVNEAGERAWEDGRPCIWREHGVWEWDSKGQKPLVMRQSYFERDPRTGRRIEWYNDCWYPFLKRFRERIVAGKKERLEWFTFAAGIPNEVSRELADMDLCGLRAERVSQSSRHFGRSQSNLTISFRLLTSTIFTRSLQR